MSNVLYIDANSRNSTILTEDNNKYRYKLPNSLSLPTGTQISAQSSVINLQGITGASIEITEDIEEKLMVQYYIKDTTFPIPQDGLVINNGDGSYKLYHDLSYVGNGVETMGGGGKYGTSTFQPEDFPHDGYGSGLLPANDSQKNLMGFSEITMPICCGSQFRPVADGGEMPLTSQYFIPMMGEIKISIPKGVYSISKIAQLITDQMNGVKIPDEDNIDFIAAQKAASEWTGYAVNNTTARRVEVMTNFPENIDAPQNYTLPYLKLWNSTGARPTAGSNPQFKSYDKGGLNTNHPPRPFTYEEEEERGIAAVGLHPEFASGVRKNIIQGYVGNNVPAAYNVDGVISSLTAEKKMFRGFNDPQFEADTTALYTDNRKNYKPFVNGFAVGSTQFKMDYDTEKNGFTIQYCHTPRFIPTYDRYGGKYNNPGQEAAFIRRPAGTNNPTENEYFNTGNNPPKNVYEVFSSPMTQTTGFMVMNWAYNTCKNKGSKPDIEGQRNDLRANLSATELEGIDKFRTYNEWFDTEKEAKDAWETTIWARLGFTYDDLQNPEKFAENYTPSIVNLEDITSFRNEGFTTDEELDSSVLTTISSQYSSISHDGSKGSTAKPTDDSIIAINTNISEVQIFNTGDVSIPFNPYNNNSKVGAASVFGYKGSLFNGAVMFPVLTKSKDVVASALPILSNDGYILITSDLVELDDITKGGQFLGILDLIPKSNLSNQDYVSDRNQMIHTLTNPKVIDDITINILNSDLTDIALRPNSTVLLKITFPIPKPTVLLSSAINQQEEQAIIQQAQAAAQAPISNEVSKNEREKKVRFETHHPSGTGDREHEADEGRHSPPPRAGGGGRAPSPEPTPEALARQAQIRSRGRLRERGREGGRYSGVVPPRFVDEAVVASGGRLTQREAAGGETGSAESGYGTRTRSASLPPEGRGRRERAPSPPPRE